MQEGEYLVEDRVSQSSAPDEVNVLHRVVIDRLKVFLSQLFTHQPLP